MIEKSFAVRHAVPEFFIIPGAGYTLEEWRDAGMIVVAAVIEKNGQVLIGQRRPKDRHPLKWEFPGGKVESGESPREALRRELNEELGIQAVIGDEITRYTHSYPPKPLFELIFFRVTEFAGELRNIVFEKIEWVGARSLPSYDFLDGDVEFVRKLARSARSRG